MFESGDFSSETQNFSLEKSKFLGNLPGKIKFFVPGFTTPRFQTRLMLLVPGMASAHSLEPFLRQSFLNPRWFYLVVLELGMPLSNTL